MRRDRPHPFAVICLVLYCLLSAFFATIFLVKRPMHPDSLYASYFIPFWSLSTDPVISFFLHAAIVIVAISLLPGIVAAMILFGIVLIALLIFLFGIQTIYALATMSVGGAILVLGSSAIIISWLFHEYPDYMNRLLDYIIVAWLRIVGSQTPQASAKLKRGIPMSGQNDEQNRLFEDIAKLSEMLDIQQPRGELGLNYEGWFEEARKRIQLRSLTYTQKEETQLLEQLNRKWVALINLDRTHRRVKRLPREDTIEDLKLEEQEYNLRSKIEQHKLSIKSARKVPDTDNGDLDI